MGSGVRSQDPAKDPELSQLFGLVEDRLITNVPDSGPIKTAASWDLSPPAIQCAAWFRQLARALKTCRLYKSDNTVVVHARGQTLDTLVTLIHQQGGWRLRFTPSEIYLGDEIVVQSKNTTHEDGEINTSRSSEQDLPFIFYRDGIRGVTITPGLGRDEAEALFEALKVVGVGGVNNDDLLTLLWQANLSHILVEAVPLEQTIYLSSGPMAEGGDDSGGGGTYLLGAAGTEIRGNLEMASGRQGLHRDTFEDWEVPGQTVEVPQAYDELMAEMEYAREHFEAAWDEENRQDWTREAPDVLRQVLILDPSEDTRQALAYSVVTWLTGALHRAAWKEAQRALELLGEIDPDHSRTSEEIAAAIVTLDAEALAEGLDEAEPEDQGRFAGLAVGLGKPAVNLVFDVMRHATRVRTRAAACTALSYLCAEEPELLGPYLSDSRWDVVLNMVFVLGQIGGPKVVDLLRVAAQHPEPKVRRQVVQALGSVPPTDRLPVLLNELDTLDSQLLSATLNMLTREKNRHVARAILDCIESPRFESRSEDSQRTLFNALADVADDEAIAALEALLNKGGWFSRRTFTRQAAARTLQRIGTLGAMAVLQTGLKSKSAAVRETCREALNAGGSV